MTITNFIADFRAQIERAKLNTCKSIKGNIVAFETCKYKESIKGFEDCVSILNNIEKQYIDKKQLNTDYLENFVYDLQYQYIELTNKYLANTTKRLFHPLDRKVWGYYNSVNKCLKLLRRQTRAYGLI